MGKRRSICVALAALALTLGVAPSLAAEGNPANPFLPPQAADLGWPCIRGPHFDGISAEINLADSWPAVGPAVLWTKELGQGYSSFVAAGDRAYTQYQTLAGQFVICLNARTGETIWEYRYDWPFQPAGLYPGPRSTPTLDSGRIYFAAPDGTLGCLDGEGKLLWSVKLKEKYGGQGTDFGYSCSPTVVDGKVIMPVGGAKASLVALDATTGDEVWKSGVHSASYTPALPISVDGHRQIIGYLENTMVCVDLATGKQLWEMPLSSGYDEHAAWPIYSEPYLWFSGPFHSGSQLLKLTGGADAKFERVHESPVMSNDVASSVLYQGHLYGFDIRDIQSKAHRPSLGSFRCLDFLTNEQRWANEKERERRPSSRRESDKAEAQPVGHASVIVADGKLFLFNDEGDLIVARASPKRYEELARARVLGGEICWAAPALHRGQILLRNHRRAVCIFVGQSELLQPTTGTPTLTVNDIPQGATRDLSYILGIEPEYALDPPSLRWLWTWYGFSLGILALATIVTAAARAALRSRLSIEQARWLFWALIFVLGIVLSKPLSLWWNDFVFTWPVSLFIPFYAAAWHVRLHNRKPAPPANERPWRDRLIVTAFVVVSVVYFAVCRQVSLATEWIFLCGFPAACAFVVGWRCWVAWSPKSALGEALLAAVAFSIFYWSAVGVLALNYKIEAF